MGEWVIAVIASASIIAITVIAVVLILSERRDQEKPVENWNVEMWNIQQGYPVVFRFMKSMVLGRFTILQNAVCDLPVKEDTTISREHVLVYEQNSVLWAWNLSEVNVAMLNEQRLAAPQQLFPGNRLKMGDSVFLITKLDKNEN